MAGEDEGVGSGAPRAPGWYPDPWSATGKGERYFDGERWGSADRPLGRYAKTPLDAGERGRGSRRRGRGGVIAISVVAAIGVAAWVATNRSSTDRRSQGATQRPTGTTTTIFGLIGVDYGRGDCVVWDQSPADTHQTHVVSCSEPHLIEISGRVDLGRRFDHFPTGAEFDGIYNTDCAAQIRSLVGRPLDPNGKFGSSGIHPSSKGWTFGERTVWCGAIGISVYKLRYLYELPLFRGRVEGADQTLLEPIGSCWSRQFGYVVPCSGPHEWEVTGYADLTGQTSEPPPEQDFTAWQRLVGNSCNRAARSYLGHDLIGDFRATSLPISLQSWVAGRRKTECIIARYAKSTILTTTGSAKR